MASRWSGRNSSSLVGERTGALWIDEPRLGPSIARASRSQVRPPPAAWSR